MGKIRESMEKASYEATKKLFWDVKKLYTTGNSLRWEDILLPQVSQ